MNNRSPLDLTPEVMTTEANKVTNLLIAHLAGIEKQPAFARHQPSDAVLPLQDAPASGQSLDDLLEVFSKQVVPFHAREPHPGFMAYVPSSPTFPALLGDWLATGFNFYAGVWPVATGPNRIELIVLDWFRRWLRMPEGTGGLLTTGGSAANLTALIAARHHVAGDDVSIVPRMVLYTSDQAHSSVSRAGWIAGIPRSAVRSIPTDEHRRLDMKALEAAVARDRDEGLVPLAVVASAGTTNTGAIDPLNAVADYCERENIWMHVDAAYGGFAVLTKRGRKALDGIGRADTVTLDPHKWLYVPFECGCLLARQPRRLFDTFAIFPEYLKDVRAQGEEVNFADYGEQLSRYNRAIKVWLSVNYFGVDAIAGAIDTTMDLAQFAESLVRKSENVEVLSPAQLGIFCFRARPRGLDDESAVDRLNEKVLARLNASGRYFISTTRLNGRLSLRICVLGFRTSQTTVENLIRDTELYALEELPLVTRS